MDRKGDCLACHGDLDMASTSFQLGLGVGLSPKLKLWHLIPPHRLSDSYLIKMKKELPIYEIMIDLNDPETTVSFNSLVEFPAHEKNFETFNKRVAYHSTKNNK